MTDGEFPGGAGGDEQLWNAMLATCPSRSALALIGSKWTVLIVITLSEGKKRFGDVRDSVDGISAKVLTDQLRQLERDGIVERHTVPESPRRVEYELTPLGRTLVEPAAALREWAESHFSEIEQNRARYDARESSSE